MSIRERIGGNLHMAAHACQRVSQEYFELARQQRGEKGRYAAVVWVYPLQVRDRDRFRTAFFTAAGASPDEETTAHFWVPFRNGALQCSVDTPSAEHAGAMLLTIVRDAAGKCGLTFDEVRIEVVRDVTEANP